MDFSEFTRPEWQLLSQVSRPSRYACSEWRPYPLIEAFIHSISMNYPIDRTYCVRPDMEEVMREHNASAAAEGVNNHGF